MADRRTPGTRVEREGGDQAGAGRARVARSQPSRLGQALVFSAVCLPFMMIAVPIGILNLSALLPTPGHLAGGDAWHRPSAGHRSGLGHTFRPDLPADPSAGAALALHAVRLERVALGRGARTWGQVSFSAPKQSRAYGDLVLEARTSLPDYGFDLPLANPHKGLATIALGCHQVRGPHLVEWHLTLHDQSGQRSAPVRVPIDCTGDVLDDPPWLTSVELATTELGGAERAAGVARFQGAHYPLRLTALSTTPGYGFRSRYVYEQGAEQTFEIGCHPGRPPHTVVWRFAAEDGRGRHGNVIQHTVRCR